jgi:hypothetical protein
MKEFRKIATTVTELTGTRSSLTDATDAPAAPAYLLVLAEIIFFDPEDGEAISSYETSVATQRTTRRHIPEDDTLHLLIVYLTK